MTHYLILWTNWTWQKFTPVVIWKVFQGTCSNDYDCVSPGFHICSENCTDRFFSIWRLVDDFFPKHPSFRDVFVETCLINTYISWNLSLVNILRNIIEKPFFSRTWFPMPAFPNNTESLVTWSSRANLLIISLTLLKGETTRSWSNLHFRIQFWPK